jgi:hypothetical protein
MFPECEKYETNRNIVRKTVEKRNKGKKKKTKKASCVEENIFNLNNYFKKTNS